MYHQRQLRSASSFDTLDELDAYCDALADREDADAQRADDDATEGND